MTAGIEDALVLRLGSDDVALLLLVEMHDALNGDVIGLGSARSENNLLGGSIDEGRDVGPGCLDGPVRFPAVEMGARVQRPAGDPYSFHADSGGVLLEWLYCRRRRRSGEAARIYGWFSKRAAERGG
nr:hypothetical protein TorRG33x02_119620 [Ipomoea batatas]